MSAKTTIENLQHKGLVIPKMTKSIAFGVSVVVFHHLDQASFPRKRTMQAGANRQGAAGICGTFSDMFLIVLHSALHEPNVDVLEMER